MNGRPLIRPSGTFSPQAGRRTLERESLALRRTSHRLHSVAAAPCDRRDDWKSRSNAVGYLVLAHVFTANMSGNTIAVGMALVDGDWSMLVGRGSVIPLFVAGALISRLTIDAARRRSVRSVEAFLVFVSIVLFVRSI
ncbi:MAG TPA: YoaK family protein [Thermoanaerobaculia bacterium]|nr:YoaK family protein [Thermoanaerobaculia bacterium]